MGVPDGVRALKIELVRQKSLKYDPTTHAEQNAHLADGTTSCLHCRCNPLHNTLYPCEKCTLNLLIAGTEEDYYEKYENTSRSDPDLQSHWENMFREAGVRLRQPQIRDETHLILRYAV